MKIEYSQTIRKRDFAQILENFLTAGHLVFSRPFPAAKQTCEMLKVWLLSCTVTYQRSRPLQQKSYQVSSLKEDNDNNKPTTNYNEQAFKMNNWAANFSKWFTSSAMIIEAVDWGRFNTLTPLRSMGRARASHAGQTVKTLGGVVFGSEKNI